MKRSTTNMVVKTEAEKIKSKHIMIRAHSDIYELIQKYEDTFNTKLNVSRLCRKAIINQITYSLNNNEQIKP